MNFIYTVILTKCFLLITLATTNAQEPPTLGKRYPQYVGTLAGRTKRAPLLKNNNIKLATVLVAWNQFEPTRGVYDQHYINQVEKKIHAYRKEGFGIVLDFGFQYPPDWARNLPNWLYQNQYGESFKHSTSGDNGINAVFNGDIRKTQQQYVAQVFKELGTDFFAVRLGWGLYGELNYPHPVHGKNKNCYWAFDPIAQGKTEGLPQGILPCPVPGWLPGQASKSHHDASKFAEWYLDSMKNYHDWQIQTVRAHYSGKLFMMMGSWMLRTGQLTNIVEKDLADTGNTEIQRGFDFGRFIMGVNDPDYVIYCTWLDAPARFCNDNTRDQTRWSPVKQFAFFASIHPLKLKVWGENTGRATREDMALTFQRCRENRVEGIFWAFEDDLFTNDTKLATFNDLKYFMTH